MQKPILPKIKQNEDYFIVNADQEEVMKIAKQSKAQIIPFSSKERTRHQVLLLKNGWVVLSMENKL